MGVTTEDAADSGPGELKVLSAQGRVGRMRYIVWTFLVGLATGLIAAIGGAILGMLAGPLGMVFIGLCYVAMLVVIVMITIQRCHDFNVTGWLSLILLVPLAPLVFWFIPGTRGANDYGPAPPPNSTAVKILFWILIGVMIVGAISSVLMPTAMIGHMQMDPMQLQ